MLPFEFHFQCMYMTSTDFQPIRIIPSLLTADCRTDQLKVWATCSSIPAGLGRIARVISQCGGDVSSDPAPYGLTLSNGFEHVTSNGFVSLALL
ncbi:hypothetical protein TNCT_99091 [Trichonephila clavata]|uniref:Uncharacterized protein n=1 Tax=Trichonephila clavata TaxID=2740835 RepID=A0A8X6J252_TRICU|nr:hypothetical protein TNCT_99091 [Trichonephila clavata]